MIPTWTGENVKDPHLCDVCGVIVVPAAGGWEHPESLLDKFSQTVCDRPEPGRVPKARELRRGHGQLVSPDDYAFPGRIDGYSVAPGMPIFVAGYGSQKFNPAGPPWHPLSWGYLASNGQYAIGTATQSKSIVGDCAFGPELRAIFWALERLPNASPISVIINSEDAVELINTWRAAGTGASKKDLPMPPGYTLDRDSGNEAKFLRMAKRFARDSDRLTVTWHSDGEHPLRIGADKLAKITRTWTVGEITKEKAEAEADRVAQDALDALGSLS